MAEILSDFRYSLNRQEFQVVKFADCSDQSTGFESNNWNTCNKMNDDTVKTSVWDPAGRNLPFLIPKIKKTCLAKQDRAGSYTGVTAKLW